MPLLPLTHTQPLRLDLALAATLGISRTQAQKLLKTEVVTGEHNAPLSAHLLMAPGTKVMLDDAVRDHPAAVQTPAAALDILFENEDVLVVNKPAGIPVQIAAGQRGSTFWGALLAHAPEMIQAGAAEGRAGMVHRLDKEASGVLIAAKSDAAFHHLKAQFAQRDVEKIYLVLVRGKVRDDVGDITFPIARSRTRARMAARPHNQEGKAAATAYTVLERFPTTTLLQVTIATGRTHQIRAHCFAIGHPVVGDPLYRPRRGGRALSPRLFLHAAKLTITLPDGHRETFAAPLPEDLDDALNALRAKRSIGKH